MQARDDREVRPVCWTSGSAMVAARSSPQAVHASSARGTSRGRAWRSWCREGSMPRYAAAPGHAVPSLPALQTRAMHGSSMVALHACGASGCRSAEPRACTSRAGRRRRTTSSTARCWSWRRCPAAGHHPQQLGAALHVAPAHDGGAVMGGWGGGAAIGGRAVMGRVLGCHAATCRGE